MELQGTIKKIFGVVEYPSGFKKRELVLTTEEQYPQSILIEFLAEKIHLLDNFNEGDRVKISIDIRGREWTSPENVVKYFTSISGWRIEKLENAKTATEQSTPNSSTPLTNVPISEKIDLSASDTEQEDGLPF